MLHIIPADIFFYIIKFIYGPNKLRLIVLYSNLQKVCKDIPIMDNNWYKIYKYIVEENNLDKINIILKSNFENNFQKCVKKIYYIFQIKKYKGKFICPNKFNNIFYEYRNPHCTTIRTFGSMLPQRNNCIVNLLLTDDCKLILKCFRTIECKVTQRVVEVENWRELTL